MKWQNGKRPKRAGQPCCDPKFNQEQMGPAPGSFEPSMGMLGSGVRNRSRIRAPRCECRGPSSQESACTQGSFGRIPMGGFLKGGLLIRHLSRNFRKELLQRQRGKLRHVNPPPFMKHPQDPSPACLRRYITLVLTSYVSYVLCCMCYVLQIMYFQPYVFALCEERP